MGDCVFCKIVSGELPCHKVYEDGDFIGFLDIVVRNKGHCLVIPKKHYRWVWDVDNIEGYFRAVKKVANAIRKAMGTEFLVSCVIGEEVPHAHVWLVPRYENDGHGSFIDLNKVIDVPEEEMKEIAEKIKGCLDGC